MQIHGAGAAIARRTSGIFCAERQRQPHRTLAADVVVAQVQVFGYRIGPLDQGGDLSISASILKSEIFSQETRRQRFGGPSPDTVELFHPDRPTAESQAGDQPRVLRREALRAYL